MFNIDKVRKDFPILGREVYNKPLVYLDNVVFITSRSRLPICTRRLVRLYVDLSMPAR